MAILMLLEWRDATLEQYERVNEIMGIRGDDDAPDGLVEHFAAGSDDGVLIVDVWESEEALGRFVESRLRHAVEEVGLAPAQPRILPLHNRLPGAGTKPGVGVVIEIDGLGLDAYDEMASKMQAHQGEGNHPGVMHNAARSESGGVVVVDVWESPEAFGQFAEQQIAPAGASVGLGPVEPRIVPIHNVIKGRARVGA